MTVTVLVTILLAGLLAGFGWWVQRREARLLATVEVVEVADFASRYLGNERPLHIFLPPHYRETQTRYPVLYLNDGQDVGQLRLRETLARLMANGRLHPLIVVAIPTNADRLQEYGTAVVANAQGLGGKAAQYNRFVVEEVRPWVNREFRTETDAAKTAVLGASLGGLAAFDLAWNHPDVFGAVGVFSGSFWWRAGDEETAVPPGRRITHSMVRQSAHHPGFRAWFQAGTRDERDDRDNNGVIDAIQDTLELMDELRTLGYENGRDLVYVEVANGRHDYATWSQVLPDFLIWAFPRFT
ncbi:MAG: esterase family protein [Chloroflexi bacterium]|nr:esterase family protein [Chloroflexota bacterium]MBP7041360.1 esterase family protein [Chloroflexota bacterium]